jgi:hypothetical protein
MFQQDRLPQIGKCWELRSPTPPGTKKARGFAQRLQSTFLVTLLIFRSLLVFVPLSPLPPPPIHTVSDYSAPHLHLSCRLLLASDSQNCPLHVSQIASPSSEELSSDESSSSASSMSSPTLISFDDELTCTTMSVDLVSDGELQTPAQLRAPIMRPLQLFKTEARLFAQRLHRRQAALLPVGSIFVECSACGRVRLMLLFVAIACQRLATAPADMHMVYSTWGWAELVMERVTRDRVRRVQVRLQLRACCAVLDTCRASACVRRVFDACCRKRWLVLRCVAAHLSGCIKRAAAFILVCRLLLPPALQADAALWTRQNTETAVLCFAI